MSGFGKRFIDYGIDIDKQILEFTDTITPFEKSLNSLKNKSDFILVFTIRTSLQNIWLEKLLIKKYRNQFDYQIINTGETKSPIHSIDVALQNMNNESPVSIFTMDIEFGLEQEVPTSGNATIVFKAKDGPYSFVILDNGDNVIDCAEKNPIGVWANAGLYSIESIGVLSSIVNESISKNKSGELSIAETLLSENVRLGFKAIKIDSIYIFGTPEEWIFYNNHILPFLKAQKQKRVVLMADHSGITFTNELAKTFISEGWETVLIENEHDLSWDMVLDGKEEQLIDEYYNKNAFIIMSCMSGQGVSNALSEVLSSYVPVIASYDQMVLCIEHSMARAISFSSNEMTKTKLNYEIFIKVLNKKFQGGRHQRRLQKMKNFKITSQGKIDNLSNYKDGWAIGNFLPRLAKLPFLEFGIKTIDYDMKVSDSHYHDSGVEISIVLEGQGKSGDNVIKKDSILIQDPYTVDKNIFEKNTKLAVIRFTDRKPKKLYYEN